MTNVIFCYKNTLNKIKWHNRARKQIKKIPRAYQDAIIDKVDQLVNFSESERISGIKKLTNHRYDYRMRVGRYRVMFDHVISENNDEVKEEINIIAIQEIIKRDERTY